MDAKTIKDPSLAANSDLDKKRFFKKTDGTYLM
jgi:hypothetical protein